MRHPRGRVAHQRNALVRLLLALLLSGAFAACGAPHSTCLRQLARSMCIGVAANGDESLVALRGSDGALLWRTPIPLDSESAIASVTATPSLVYIVSGGKPSSGDWSLMAVNAESGKVVWSFAAGSLITGIQTLGNMVYLGSLYGGGVRALRASDGHLLWQHPGNVPAFSLAVDTLYAAMTGAGAGDNSVVALRASNGAQQWQTPLSEAGDYVIVESNERVYRHRKRGRALRTSDGSALWHSQVAGGVLNGAAGWQRLCQPDRPANGAAGRAARQRWRGVVAACRAAPFVSFSVHHGQRGLSHLHRKLLRAATC